MTIAIQAPRSAFAPRPAVAGALAHGRRRALLIVNQHSRRGVGLDLPAVISRMAYHGVAVDVAKLRPRQGIADAIRRHVHGCDLVMVAGGDGSMSRAAAAILDTGLPLALLPTGTANDLAHTLELPTDIEAACDVAATGQLRAIDIGRVNGRPFFNAATIGLSVEVARRLTRERKRRWGVLGYGITLADAWRAAHQFTAEVVCDGEFNRLKSSQITIGNGERHGGGIPVAPDAAIDDAQLDLYSLAPRSFAELIALGGALRRGKHEEWDSVLQLHGREMLVVTERPMPVSTDGEVTTRTPALFSVLPRAVQVLVPPEGFP